MKTRHDDAVSRNALFRLPLLVGHVDEEVLLRLGALTDVVEQAPYTANGGIGHTNSLQTSVVVSLASRPRL